MNNRKELPPTPGFNMESEHPLTFQAKHLHLLRNLEKVTTTYLAASLPPSIGMYATLDAHPEWTKPGTEAFEVNQSDTPEFGRVRLREGELRCADLLKNVCYGTDAGYTLESLFQQSTAIRSVFNISSLTHDGNPLTSPGLRGTIMNLVTFRELTCGHLSEMGHLLTTVLNFISTDLEYSHNVIFSERSAADPYRIEERLWDKARARCGQTAWGVAFGNIFVTLLQKVKALEVTSGVILATPAVTIAPAATGNNSCLGADLCKEIDRAEAPTYQGHENEKLMKISLAGGEQQTITWGMQQMIFQITVHFENLRYRLREQEREMTAMLASNKLLKEDLLKVVTASKSSVPEPDDEHKTKTDKDSFSPENRVTLLQVLHSLIKFTGLGCVTSQNVVMLKGTTTSDGNNIPAAKLPNQRAIDLASGVDAQHYPVVPKVIEPVEGVDIYSSLNDLWVFVTQMGIKIKDVSDETRHELKKLLKMIEQEHTGSLISRVGHIEKQ